MWVSDRSNYFFVPQIMDGSRLNANVVSVKLDGKEMFFDPGSEFTAFGMLPWVETGVNGLKLDKRRQLGRPRFLLPKNHASSARQNSR